MPKVIGRLYPDPLPRFITKLLNFTSDGNVRSEGHITPDPTPGVAESRLLVKAIDPTIEKIHAGLRAQLIAIVPAPSNWAARITSRTIGDNRNNWAADAAAYTALAAADRADWIFAANFIGIDQVSILDTTGVTHTLTGGQTLFHVATGIWRIGLLDQPEQPAANNANAWITFLFDQVPILPDNVMTLDGQPMTLGEDYLTL
jgi:hypothetical protein